MTTTTSFAKGFAHGLYVGSTGNMNRLQTLQKQAQKSQVVAASWKQVGKSMNRALKTSK